MKNKNKASRSVHVDFKQLNNHIRSNKLTFAVYLTLRIIVIAAMVISVIGGRYENLFACSFALISFLVPSFVERNFGIHLPTTLEIVILLFIFASVILGELGGYYVKVPMWDTMLHTVNGFLCAGVGFSLVDVVNRNNKFKFSLSPLYVAIVAFCFSMTVGVLWEMFEFSADFFLGTDMQKDFIIHRINTVALCETSENTPVLLDNIREVTVNGKELGVDGYIDIGLIDTMKDLMVNLVGAFVFSVLGLLYIKGRSMGKIAKRFIPFVEEDDVEHENSDE